jgi:hypothetical protein
MGAAFGGVTGAINLAVKAVSSYVKYLKEAEALTLATAKATGKALTEAVGVYDDLKKAQEEEKRLIGEISLETNRAINARRIERIENRNVAKELALQLKNVYGDEQAIYRFRHSATQQFITDSESRITQYKIEQEKIVSVYIDSLARQSAARDKALGVRASSGVGANTGTPVDTTAADAEKARLEAIAKAAQVSNTNAAMSYRDMKAKEAMAEQETWEFIEGLRDEAQKAELARIQELKDKEKELAEASKKADEERLSRAISVSQGVVSAWQSTVAAIGNLIHARYQAEIDAAEEGSDEQKKLMKEQWEAEKRYAIAKAAIDIASGVLANLKTWWMIPFVLATGALQLAALKATKPPKFATGTPPGGYVVPEGYSNDSFPVQARSGERVTVTPPGGQGSGQQTIILQLDGRALGRAVTKMFDRRQALVPTGAIV